MEPTINNTNDSSANTVLIAVIIVVIIGIAFYFGVIRGHVNNGGAGDTVNVELNTPDLGGSGDAGGAGATQ